MDLEERLALVMKEPTQEVVPADGLRGLLESNEHPKHYIGFEISGLLHVGSLIVSGIKINDLKTAGFQTQVLLADWHSIINDKLGGDWKAIEKASGYYEEAFKLFCPGVKIVRGSDYYDNDYWRDVIQFSKNVTLPRATRCMQIMGRSETASLDVAKFFYPSMQAVDMKHLEVDLAHAGMDQRKVHMLARDVYPKMGWKPPVALHHEILPSLLKPEEGGEDRMDSKMSKSKPNTAVFVHDSTEAIGKKLAKAYCPQEAEGNPVLAVARVCCFRNDSMVIERPEKFGGDLEFASYAELEKEYLGGKLHAADLKNGVAAGLDALIAPVRKHFEEHPEFLRVYDTAAVTR